MSEQSPETSEAQQESQQESPAWTPPASQADLDRIIEGRLARERDKFKNFDEFREKAAKWDAHEANGAPDAQAIESAKAQAVADTAQKFLQRLVTTEVRAQASSLGFNDPSDALTVLGDELPVKDDEPDSEAIKQLVEKLAADKPYLLATTRRRPSSRPKPREGEPVGDEGTPGKGRAAAALRQLAAARKGSTGS